MPVSQNVIQGPLSVAEEMVVREIIAGDATVLQNGRLVLHGTVSGDVLVEEGGEAFLYGIVTGTVINKGKAHISGTVLNGIDNAPGATLNIAENSSVTGGIRRS